MSWARTAAFVLPLGLLGAESRGIEVVSLEKTNHGVAARPVMEASVAQVCCVFCSCGVEGQREWHCGRRLCLGLDVWPSQARGRGSVLLPPQAWALYPGTLPRATSPFPHPPPLSQAFRWMGYMGYGIVLGDVVCSLIWGIVTVWH